MSNTTKSDTNLQDEHQEANSHLSEFSTQANAILDTVSTTVQDKTQLLLENEHIQNTLNKLSQLFKLAPAVILSLIISTANANAWEVSKLGIDYSKYWTMASSFEAWEIHMTDVYWEDIYDKDKIKQIKIWEKYYSYILTKDNKLYIYDKSLSELKINKEYNSLWTWFDLNWLNKVEWLYEKKWLIFAIWSDNFWMAKMSIIIWSNNSEIYKLLFNWWQLKIEETFEIWEELFILDNNNKLYQIDYNDINLENKSLWLKKIINLTNEELKTEIWTSWKQINDIWYDAKNKKLFFMEWTDLFTYKIETRKTNKYSWVLDLEEKIVEPEPIKIVPVEPEPVEPEPVTEPVLESISEPTKIPEVEEAKPVEPELEPEPKTSEPEPEPEPEVDLNLQFSSDYKKIQLLNETEYKDKLWQLEIDLGNLETDLWNTQTEITNKQTNISNLKQEKITKTTTKQDYYNSLDNTSKVLLDPTKTSTQKQQALEWRLPRSKRLKRSTTLPTKNDVLNWKQEILDKINELEREIEPLKSEMERKKKLYDEKYKEYSKIKKEYDDYIAEKTKWEKLLKQAQKDIKTYKQEIKDATTNQTNSKNDYDTAISNFPKTSNYNIDTNKYSHLIWQDNYSSWFTHRWNKIKYYYTVKSNWWFPWKFWFTENGTSSNKITLNSFSHRNDLKDSVKTLLKSSYDYKYYKDQIKQTEANLKIAEEDEAEAILNLVVDNIVEEAEIEIYELEKASYNTAKSNYNTAKAKLSPKLTELANFKAKLETYQQKLEDLELVETKLETEKHDLATVEQEIEEIKYLFVSIL